MMPSVWISLWLLVLCQYQLGAIRPVASSNTVPYINHRLPASDCGFFYSGAFISHLNQFWFVCSSSHNRTQAVVWMADTTVGVSGASGASAIPQMTVPDCIQAIITTDPFSKLIWLFCSNDHLITITPSDWTTPIPNVIYLPPQVNRDCRSAVSSNPTQTNNGSVLSLICFGPGFTNFTVFKFTQFDSSQLNITAINYPQQLCHLGTVASVVDVFGNLFVPCRDFSNILMVDAGGRNSTLSLVNYCLNNGVYSLAYDSSKDDLYVACSISNIYVIHHPSNSTLRTIELILNADQCSVPSSLSWDASIRTLAITCLDPGVLYYRPDAIGTKSVVCLNSIQCGSPEVYDATAFSFNGQLIASCAQGVLSASPGAFVEDMGAHVCLYSSELIQDAKTGKMIQSCVAGKVSLAYLNGGEYTPFQTSDVCDLTQDVIIDSSTGTMVVACVQDGILVRYADGRINYLIDFFDCVDFYSLELDEARQTVYVLCSGDGVYAIQYELGSYTTLLDTSMCSRFTQIYYQTNSTSIWIGCVQPQQWSHQPFSSLFKFDTIQQSYTTIFSNSSFCVPHTVFGDPTISNVLFIYCDGFGIISLDLVTENVNFLVPESSCSPATSFKLSHGRLYFMCHFNSVYSFDLEGALIQPNLISNSTRLAQSNCDLIVSLWVDPTTSQIFMDCLNKAISVSGNNFQCFPGTEWLSGDCSLCTLGKYRNYDLIRSEVIPCQTCSAGGVAPQIGTIDCALCLPGRFAVSSVIDCQPCPAGTYQPSSGQTGCLPCPSGYYGSDLSLNSSTCSGPCLPGYWCGEGSILSTQLPCGSSSVYCPLNSSFPLIVSPGYFSDQPAVLGTVNTYTTQTPCPIGSECDGSGLSRLCGTGRYQNLTGQSLCTACEVGRYANRPGLTQCHDCEPGSYTDTLGSPICTRCSPGEYTSFNGSTICSSCTAGSSAGSSGYSLCDQCTPGRYTNQTHTLQCQPCPTGYKQSEYGSIKCDPCPAGEYAFDFTSTECQPCQPGRYSDQPGSSTCLPCSQGSASNETGRSSPCELCLPGSFQSQPASLICIPCTVKTYSSTPGSLGCQDCNTVTNNNRSICYPNGCQSNTEYDSSAGECRSCLLGQTSAAGFSCGSCPSNTYTPYLGSGCVSCTYPGMDGIQCAGGFPSIISGYWAYQIETYVNEIPDRKILLFQSTKCPEGFCQGAELQPRITNSSVDSSVIISTFHPDQCSFPRVNDGLNVLCAGCASGYIPWGDSCVSCTTVNGGLIVLYLFLSFLLVLFLSRSSLGSSAGYSVVLLYFAQTAMLEVGPVRGWLAWIGIVNFNGTNGTTGTCLAPWNQYEQTLLSLLMPIFLLAEMMFIACIRRLLSTTRWNLNGQSMSALPPQTSKLNRMMYYISSDFSWSRYVGASMSILLFCYTQATSTCIRYLTCVTVGEAKVVFSAPTMDCRSDTYKAYLVPVVLVLIIYVVGFPLGILAFLWSRRTKLADRSILLAIQQLQQQQTPLTDSENEPIPSSNSTSVSKEVVHQSSQNNLNNNKSSSMSVAFVERWGPLFQMYSQSAWFWTCTVLIRRALVVIMSVALVEEPHARGLAFILLTLSSLLLQLIYRPFTDEAINTAEVLSQVLLLVLSAILTAYIPPYPVGAQVVMFLLIVPPCAFFLFRLVHQGARTLHQRIRRGRSLRQRESQEDINEYKKRQDQPEVKSHLDHPVLPPICLSTPLEVATATDVELIEIQPPPSPSKLGLHPTSSPHPSTLVLSESKSSSSILTSLVPVPCHRTMASSHPDEVLSQESFEM